MPLLIRLKARLRSVRTGLLGGFVPRKHRTGQRLCELLSGKAGQFKKRRPGGRITTQGIREALLQKERVGGKETNCH